MTTFVIQAHKPTVIDLANNQRPPGSIDICEIRNAGTATLDVTPWASGWDAPLRTQHASALPIKWLWHIAPGDSLTVRGALDSSGIRLALFSTEPARVTISRSSAPAM
jgi:hypothetical protein